ncbi:MAG TPA: hypothetical protein VMY99_04720 [Nevskiaceae bacterium]|nr:hypothetical protein [Nevskiaceae bacterium]
MRRLEVLAAHLLFYMVFLAAFLNACLMAGIHIARWQLPVSYVVYLVGVALVKRRRITWQAVLVAMLAPLLFLGVAKGFGMLYDSSWDGQDYHATAIVALSEGWNPWRDQQLPITPPEGTTYVLGYPKTIWLVQTSVYKLTGRLNAAAVTNAVIMVAAFGLVYGVLRRLKLAIRWAVPIALLAVLQIHAVQQLPTLMADGYSYELALAAIAAFVVMLLESDKRLPLAILASAWLLLAGGKFSNLVICALLGVAVLWYGIKVRAYVQPGLRNILGACAILGLLTLWVPYATNTLNHHSPVYPQNQRSETAKLKFDNIPNNLKQQSKLGLLFYGMFSRPLPPGAGNPKSPQNVAALKVPFTFKAYEIKEVSNFQGRVGSGGLFFSGLVVVSLIVFGWLIFRDKNQQERYIFNGISILTGLILLSALVLPVPNKLRYSPLVTLIPLLVVIALLTIRRKAAVARIGLVILVVFITANTLVAGITLATARLADTRQLRTQLAAMQATGDTYQVRATAYYSSYIRLREAGVPFVIADTLHCAQPQALALTYGTTKFCKQYV